MFIKDLLNELTFTQINAAGQTAVTATGATAAVAFGGTQVGEAVISVDAPAATAGTNPTLTFTVTTSATSGGTYTALTDSFGNAVTFPTVVTSSGGTGDVFMQTRIDTRSSLGYIKVNYTIGGTVSPSFPSPSVTLISSAQVH